MDDYETDAQSNISQFIWKEMTPQLQMPFLRLHQADILNSEECQLANMAFLNCQQQFNQSGCSEQNQNHSESGDNGTSPSTPGNGTYLSPNKNFRCDSVRSMNTISKNEIDTRRNIKRNGTLPNLSKDASSSAHYQPFLHNYLQVPQSQSARSNSSIASMQSDLESCVGDTYFQDEFIETKAIEIFIASFRLVLANYVPYVVVG
ncbi:Neprilysin-1 [Dirofilaria immitis]